MVIIFKQLYLWKGKEKVTEIVGKHEETPKKKKRNKLLGQSRSVFIDMQ